jgi:hypothetical protein
MQWFRNWWRQGRRSRPASQRPTFRPSLEQLEGRLTPSINQTVSAVADQHGNTMTFDVHSDGTVWLQLNNGSFGQVDSNARSVSASTDPSGYGYAFVTHKDGTVTSLHPADPGANSTWWSSGWQSVEALPGGYGLAILNNGDLYEYDPNLPGGLYWLVDSNVWQVSRLISVNGTPMFVDLHNDGSVYLGWTDGSGALRPLEYGLNQTPLTNIQSITSDAKGDVWTVDYSGDMQQWRIYGENGGGSAYPDQLVADYGNAGGAGFFDVNAAPNGNWAAMTFDDRLYFNGSFLASNVYAAYAGPVNTCLEVTSTGALYQWSPDTHWVVQNHDGFLWGFQTNWTFEDSNVTYGN